MSARCWWPVHSCRSARAVRAHQEPGDRLRALAVAVAVSPSPPTRWSLTSCPQHAGACRDRAAHRGDRSLPGLHPRRGGPARSVFFIPSSASGCISTPSSSSSGRRTTRCLPYLIYHRRDRRCRHRHRHQHVRRCTAGEPARRSDPQPYLYAVDRHAADLSGLKEPITLRLFTRAGWARRCPWDLPTTCARARICRVSDGRIRLNLRPRAVQRH